MKFRLLTLVKFPILEGMEPNCIDNNTNKITILTHNNVFIPVILRPPIVILSTLIPLQLTPGHTGDKQGVELV